MKAKKFSPVFPLSLSSSDTEQADNIDTIKQDLFDKIDSNGDDDDESDAATIDYTFVTQLVKNFGKKRVIVDHAPVDYELFS